MKLMSINLWGGRKYEPLANLLNEYSNDIDIFCFQEVFDMGVTSRPVHKESTMDLFDKLRSILSNFNGSFNSLQDNEEGSATFIRKDIEVLEEGEKFVFRWRNSMENNDARTLGRLIQYSQIMKSSKSYLIANFHGLWNGQGKIDTPERLLQSKNIRNFLDKYSVPKILCGDFNLLPDTESLAILEKGYTNLIKKHGIISTRSSFYERSDKFADYILISPGIVVTNFEVLNEKVSDHLPLFLEFI